MKLKAFLQATKSLDATLIETVKVVKESCLTMGHELNMADADLAGDDTGKICNAVFATFKNNLQVGMKAGAKLDIHYTPGKCTVDANASASAGGGCSGDAAAGGGGAGASGQCAAAAQVNASVNAQCTPPELTVDAKAGVVVDKSKIDADIAAMKDGIPKLLSVSYRIQPLKDAYATWAASLKDLQAMGPKFVQSFGDQAMCISGQLAAAASASTRIQANVNVSVSVSASASGSVGG
ncbi:MAG TPA: hypothetical protein VGG28_03580 [Kofleriaceae bacterium]|jgi:hypothetical protein